MEKQNFTNTGSGSTFLKCLGCSKLVKLPAQPDPDAIVRCPRCHESYPISMLLDSEIPELEIVTPGGEDDSDSDGGVEIQTDEQNRFIVAPALAKGAKRKKRRRSSSGSSESSNSRERSQTREQSTTSGPSIETSSASGSSRASEGRSNSSERSSSSRRRKKKSPPPKESGGFEFAKIILGALMAPPVAQLVIWWGLTLDPLKLGPTVANVIPAVVPAEFRGDKDEDDDSSSDENKSENDDDSNGWSNPSSGNKIDEDLPTPPSNIENRAREIN
jgi:hypothetical protein